MPKIELEKNLWISDLSMEFMGEGLHQGVYGAKIIFAGGACPGHEFLAEVVRRIIAERFPKRKVVRITGFINPTDQDVRLLVKSLRDAYGFEVHLIYNGELAYDFMQWITWSIIRTSRTQVIQNSNEVWYEPPVPDDKVAIPELELPPSSAALLYLKKGLSKKQTIDFICTSKYNWNLL